MSDKFKEGDIVTFFEGPEGEQTGSIDGVWLVGRPYKVLQCDGDGLPLIECEESVKNWHPDLGFSAFANDDFLMHYKKYKKKQAFKKQLRKMMDD